MIVEDLLHDQRREAQRRLVQKQELRAAHERAGDGQHLLLAARERAAALLQALLQAREQGADPLEILVEMGQPVHGRAHLQVLEHGHAREDAPPFRGLGDRQARDLVGRHLGDVPPRIGDRALARARVAEDRHHQGRLAGAVGADQRDDLALVDIHVDALQGDDVAVDRSSRRAR